ncbi:MAG: hypothetical protein IKL89_05235 [Clostridia bacterium]|nr:hypothetical protein [Clostridia bacterium]
MNEFTLQHGNLTLIYDPENFKLSVRLGDLERHWIGMPHLTLAAGGEVSFAGTFAEAAEWTNGLTKAVRAVYRGFRTPEGEVLPISAVTTVGIDLERGDLRCEIRLEDEPCGTFSELFWPPAFSFDDNSGRGFTILPEMQGMLIPAKYDEEIIRPDQHVLMRRGTMPIYGQTANGFGILSVFETFYDCSYGVDHPAGGDTVITPSFRPSLGYVGDRRAMLFILRPDYTYSEMAQDWRALQDERGAVATLKEKIARNPNIEYMLGSAIVHDGIAGHVSPDSYYYNRLESNDWYRTFDSLAEALRGLKAKGLDHVYLHTDGWGKHGYDNLHPDPFPPHEEAGGVEGMRRLADTCEELGYYFGIHDQYRDYYYDAPTFTFDNAVQKIDGSHTYNDHWFGGKQSMLCQGVALGHVRRNYNKFEELGIKIRGSYLDVYSIVEPDECFNPDHRLTRKESVEKRCECLEFLNSRGIIPSSEEVVDAYLKVLPLVHHAPYITDPMFEKPAKGIGIAVPFVNLCYHDCVLIPWEGCGAKDKGGTCIPDTDWAYLHLIQNAGIPYAATSFDAEAIERVKFARELQKKLAHCRMLEHTFLDDNYRIARTVYSDGTTITVNFDEDTFTIE